jgi:hypothetical protein
MGTIRDICGGTMDAPGNCTEFMCDTWLQGVRIPNYEWEGGNINETKIRAELAQLTVSPANVVKVIRAMVHSRVPMMRLFAAQAGTAKNVYTADGYPALTVGCADTGCSLSQPTESTSHTVAIAVGSAAGALVLIIVIALVLKRSSTRHGEEGEAGTLLGGKGYKESGSV